MASQSLPHDFMHERLTFQNRALGTGVFLYSLIFQRYLGLAQQ